MTLPINLHPSSERATDIVGLARLLIAGEVRARDVVESLLGRIERLDPVVNAVVTVDVDGARARADELDRIRAAGRVVGPLHGVPVTVKDTIETASLRTTAGASRFVDHVPAVDAPCVAALRRAGAVVVGKTNVPSMAGDYQTYNRLFGLTRNPADPERTVGGSSGGSAAAVATGTSLLDIGSDTAGSLSLPAHYCGVFAHKPTYGAVTTVGHVPPNPGSLLERDLLVIGPVGRSAADLALVLDVLIEGTRRRGVVPTLDPPREVRPTDLRVALWLDAPGAPIAAEVRRAIEAAVDLVASWCVVTVVEPVVDVVEAQLVAGRALGAASSILVDDERFAFAGAASDTLPRHGVTYAETLVCGTGDRHRSWLVDLEWRRAYEARWDRFFEDYDVVICPVSPVSAFPHQLDGVRGERRITIDGAIASYYAQLAWPALVSLAGLPATTVPVGRTPGGLPVGAQVIGPYLGDRTSLAFAGLLGMAVGAQVGGDLP